MLLAFRTYDVFDQQFANFFISFFATGEQGTRVFGYVTTMGELLNASIMFFAPLIIVPASVGKRPAAGWVLCLYALLAHRVMTQLIDSVLCSDNAR